MATDGKNAAKNVRMLKSAMGMKGKIQPGDLTMRAHEIMAQKPKAKKLPSAKSVAGVAFRGLI